MSYRLASLAVGLALAAGVAPGGRADEPVKSLREDLRLERLFPEKSVFGPSASSASFSFDGRYASWRYRPYDERRHGSDLYILDTESGETTRVTSVSVMSPFSADARKVRDHRIERWKKKHGGRVRAGDDPIAGSWTGALDDAGDAFPPEGLSATLEVERGEDGTITGRLVTALNAARITDGRFDEETGELALDLRDATAELDGHFAGALKDGHLEGTLTVASMGWSFDVQLERGEPELTGDEVLEDDADDEKGPRYAGVSSYVWSPVAHELILSSEGELYRYPVGGDLTRLTTTRERERAAQYTPDGSGYLYLRDGALIRVTFDSDRIEQIDPALDGGWSLGSFNLSPDGRRLALVASKGTSSFATGQRVKIVNYRSRFAEVREVNRHMSDDKLPDYWWSVWLYELDDLGTEAGALRKVHEHKQSGPRDVVSAPTWAPDSSRVTFTTYEQSSGHASIFEARFLTEDERAEAEDQSPGEDEEPDPSDRIEDARVVYRLLHYGGPTTPPMMDPEFLWDSRRIAFLAELSGYRQIHVLDPVDEHLEQLTTGRFEVYPAGVSKDHRTMFATSTKGDPTQQHVFAIDLETGEMRRLSSREGFYSGAAVSEDGSKALASFVDFGSPRELVYLRGEDVDPEVLTDSHPPEAHALTEPVPEYFTYLNRHGQEIHGHMFKPDDWTPEDKRPLLIYVYGGPLGTRKMATRGSFSAPSYSFAYYMAKKHGYVTCTIDPRGVSGYGGHFEKANFEQVGRPQVEDLVDGAHWFIENQGVDPERVGIHGWSFGGFQTQMCLYTEPDVFAVGIAGAGPTEWENYNSWYSTGTIGPSREGHTDLEEFSLLPLAKNLKAHLLLVHGMEDSNVLYQDTVRVYRELLKAGKEALVDLFLDPTGNHGLGGDVKTLNRYRKYEAYLNLHLGEGTPPE